MDGTCQVLHLPRKKNGGAPNAALATQNEPKGRRAAPACKTSRMGPKCCACHATDDDGVEEKEDDDVEEDDVDAPIPKHTLCASQLLQVLHLPRKKNAAPATQNEPKGRQVLHLPRKTSRMDPKCCACHANRRSAQCNQSLPDLRGSMKVLQVLHLPRKTSRRSSKCFACHAKRAGWAPNAAPATQTEAKCNQSSPDFRGSL